MNQFSFVNLWLYDGDAFLLFSVDILTIYSRPSITFTRQLKKKIGIVPDDKIIVYPQQKQYNDDNDKSMIFKVQRDGEIVNIWILTQNNDIDKKRYFYWRCELP